MIKRITLCIMCVAFVLSFAACSKTNETKTPDETYNMHSALDAAQYCSFVNKEIDAVTNQLSSNMIVGKKVADKEYPAADAAKTAEASIDIIEAAYKQVDTMIPPEQYKENRENVLRLMTAAKEDIKTYLNILNMPEVDSKALMTIVSVMQGDFTSLTSEFNVYYK